MSPGQHCALRCRKLVPAAVSTLPYYIKKDLAAGFPVPMRSIVMLRLNSVELSTIMWLVTYHRLTGSLYFRNSSKVASVVQGRTGPRA